ncbi:MAG: nucleoside phosphorylase [Firmicutes bacterium]|nr:nucleoside phosphorylase [Bacillota bacterium]
MAKQHHIQLEYGDVGEYVLLAGDPGRIPKIAQHFTNPELVADNRGYVSYRGELAGVRVGAVTQGIGAPSAAIVVEELIKSGVKTIIRVGTSGGISTQVEPGDLVVPIAAVRHEGLTSSYLPLSFPAVADPWLTLTLAEALTENGYRCHVGLIETKDSFYGQVEAETMPLRADLNNRWALMTETGVLATEMECSALFVIGTVRRIRTGAIVKVMINDNITPGREVSGEDDLVEAAVTALKRVIEKDRAAK